jgi:hypothetical protein
VKRGGEVKALHRDLGGEREQFDRGRDGERKSRLEFAPARNGRKDGSLDQPYSWRRTLTAPIIDSSTS